MNNNLNPLGQEMRDVLSGKIKPPMPQYIVYHPDDIPVSEREQAATFLRELGVAEAIPIIIARAKNQVTTDIVLSRGLAK